MLKESKSKLEEKIEDISSKQVKEKLKMGIDIKNLNIFKCNKCDDELMLYDGIISENQVINGKLKCYCGEEYSIVEGILKISNKFDDIDGLSQHEFLMDYIKETNSKYLATIYKESEWMYKKIELDNFRNKIILEPGVGAGFFLRNIYKNIPNSSTYIAVDHDIRRLKYLRGILQMLDYKRNIIFICCDFKENRRTWI